MTAVKWSRVGLVSCALLLAACQAPVALIQLDNEWVTTYTARKQAADDDLLLLSTDFDGRLADLSRRAEAQGDTARVSDPAMAAAFYRIAAAAGWQSGAQREADLLSIRDKGVAACDSLPNHDVSLPRDCTFIRLMPSLALFEVKLREAESLKTDGADPTFPMDDLGTVVRLAREVAGTATEPGLIGELAAVLRGPAAAALDESFNDYIRQNMNREHCAVRQWLGILSNSGASQSDQDAMATSAQSSQTKLREVQASTACSSADR